MNTPSVPENYHYLFTINGTPFYAHQREAGRSAVVLGTFMTLAAVGYPRLPFLLRLLLGVFWFALAQVLLGIHAVGHIYTAKRAGAPMDEVHIVFGLKTNVYHDNAVAPEQHIGRAIGGPVISGLIASNAFVFWRMVWRLPLIGRIAYLVYITSTLIFVGSSLPAPTFDGHPLIKWAVTARTGEEALGEEAAQQAGLAAAIALCLAGFFLLFRGKWRMAVLCFGAGLAVFIDLVIFKGTLPQQADQ
jgi:ABC-type multidrug transport system fused ATPase/permease subunit